ncbi:MAG: hypothetical protein ACR2MB_07975 [Acidimicrobiales bacterium]
MVVTAGGVVVVFAGRVVVVLGGRVVAGARVVAGGRVVEVAVLVAPGRSAEPDWPGFAPPPEVAGGADASEPELLLPSAAMPPAMVRTATMAATIHHRSRAEERGSWA